MSRLGLIARGTLPHVHVEIQNVHTERNARILSAASHSETIGRVGYIS